jgi:glutamine synthetase
MVVSRPILGEGGRLRYACEPSTSWRLRRTRSAPFTRNRSACARIPVSGANPKAKRVVFRVPDPSCNPHLPFSAMLMAGLDGVRGKMEPPDPIDKDLHELPPQEHASVRQTPGSLDEVLHALEEDHDYLTAGGVFTPDLIETWIAWKRQHEIDPVRLRPTPHEFNLYYDA